MTDSVNLAFYEESERVVLVADKKTPLGEITWIINDGVMTINHTFVDQAFRGQGIAESLVGEAVAIARRKNLKVNPLCPYAKGEFERKSEYQDLLITRNS